MVLTSDVRRRVATVVPPLLVGLLALPFVLHQNSWWEWSTPLWLLQRQTAYVSAHGTPTSFLHIAAGAFYPFYVFYGGFTLSVLAYPSAVLGAWTVFAAVSVGALVSGYLGIWWAARNLGLSPGTAVLPALTFVTTPYVLSDLYGRGAWAEFVGVNAVAVMVGGLTSLMLHPERRPTRACAALVGSAALVAGTHNITMLLSTLALPLIVAALLPLALHANGASDIARQLGRGILAIMLGVGLTGAWLVSDLWLGPQTDIADPTISASELSNTLPLLRVANVLSPWPSIPAEFRLPMKPMVFVQPPVLAMAFASTALVAVAWRRRRGADGVAASAAVLAALGTLLLLVIVEPGWWASFPEFIRVVQHPMRVVPYLAIVVALASAMAFAAMPSGRGRRIMTGGLVIVAAAHCAMAAFIVIDSKAGPSYPPPQGHASVRAEVEPPTFAYPLLPAVQFRVSDRPIGMGATRSAYTGIWNAETSEGATLKGTGRVGEHRRTAVVWSPLVRVDGDARITGRRADGSAVVTITHTDGAGRWSATARSRCALCLGALSGRDPWQLLAGRLMTLLSGIVLAGAVVVALHRRRRRRANRAVAVEEKIDPAPERAPAPVR
ncbi:MAG TPA: hypothetical protein VK501_05015 [Baekduia sp.]|uniref:hypothetical protein n=1 Tax=Baekduia sp. TaxID=2600305 RepID=UPI002B931B38|nr:hypothetical protein [Baekduia sp.]HMJ33258.1 hypothetical protein [Baekduia sp.]